MTRALQHEVSVLQNEVKLLHTVLAQRLGLNSRGIKDALGKEFAVSVDEEHKATSLHICNFANPHGRAFHTSLLHWQQKSFHRVSRLVAFSGPVVRVTTRVSIGAVYFGALYVIEAQGSLNPRRHGRPVRGAPTSVPHVPRTPGLGLGLANPNPNPNPIPSQVVWLLRDVLHDVHGGTAHE